MRPFTFILALVGCVAALAQTPPTFTERSFKDATFERCDLSGAKLIGCALDKLAVTRSQGGEIAFEDCELPKLSLRATKLRGLSCYDVDMREARFDRGTLEDARFSSVVLNEITFDRCEAHRQRWTYCDLRELYLERVEIRNPRFENVTLSSGSFQYVDFSWSRMTYCEFDATRFERGSMRGASFGGTDFSDVRLDGCNIRGMRINGVNIEELLRKAGH